VSNVILLESGRVGVTDAARKLIEQLKAAHGPSCSISRAAAATAAHPCASRWANSNWGSIDEKVGEIAGCEVWMDREQFKLWAHTRWTIDVVAGRGASFSLEAPLNLRFLIRSSLCAAPDARPPSLRVRRRMRRAGGSAISSS